VATITQQGGKVVVPPMDIEPGRFSIASDPQGAPFAVIAVKTAPVSG
jgi:predicted enzyme related to lactoylglutathione lyase